MASNPGGASIARNVVIVACATSLCTTFAHMGMEALRWDIQECNASAEFSRVTQRSHMSLMRRSHGSMR